jgi:hypothetical protein
LRTLSKFLKPLLKALAIDWEVIHEYFHDISDQVREDHHHTPLKWSRCTVKTKRHLPVGECAVGIGEGNLTLVIRMNENLMINRISIKVAEEWVLRQLFKHLINERERDVIFPGGLVEHPVIDAHPPTSNFPMRYELILSFWTIVMPSFFGITWTGLTHSLSCTG